MTDGVLHRIFHDTNGDAKQAEQQLTSSLLATVSAAYSVDHTGAVAMATVAAELARRSTRPLNDAGARFEPELSQITELPIVID